MFFFTLVLLLFFQVLAQIFFIQNVLRIIDCKIKVEEITYNL